MTWESVIYGCRSLVLYAAQQKEAALACAERTIMLNKCVKKALVTGVLPLFFATQVSCISRNSNWFF
jgi:hypothetical protein